MVSFSCEECGDIFTKKKLDPHRNRCYGATFTCIDCMTHFPGTQYRTHTSCMSEEQKYQGALYKEKPNKKQQQQQKQQQQHQQQQNGNAMSQQAYVEDAGEDVWAHYDGPTEDERSPAEAPPEAPTPPSAVPEAQVNVFDFLIATGQTPNASNLDLPKNVDADSTSLVRYEYNAHDYLDMAQDVQEDALVTPAAKQERRKTKDSEGKKDKKRKRLHVDVPGDHEMTDAPPVLHSGLTGGLKNLLRSGFPPSPEFSGNDADIAPASPLKRHKKKDRHSSLLSGLMGAKSSGKSSSKKRKTSSSSKEKKEKKEKRESRRESKMIEYKKENEDGAVILYKPRANLFLDFVDADSERGTSVNKALKRFHRQRKHANDCAGKKDEEKELWRSLRLKVNAAGEVVVVAA